MHNRIINKPYVTNFSSVAPVSLKHSFRTSEPYSLFPASP